MPETRTLLQAMLVYQREHGVLAARQLMAEAFEAAAANLPKPIRGGLEDIPGIGDNVGLEVIGRTAWLLNEEDEHERAVIG